MMGDFPVTQPTASKHQGTNQHKLIRTL